MIKNFFAAFVLIGHLLQSAALAQELSTMYLEANSLNFTCTVLTSPQPKQNVLLLQGFPNSRFWYQPLLLSWVNSTTSSSISAVACDLRGYSPGASPDSIGDYHYDVLASDVFALADAANFTKFHLVGQ